MEIETLETKLTPAAKQALDELLSEYRRRVLVGAAGSASRLTGDVREISVQDIVTGWTNDQRQPLRRARTVDWILRSYTLGGIVIAVGSISFFVYQNVLNSHVIRSLDPDSRLALIVGFSGAALAVLSYTVQQARRTRAALSVARMDTPQYPGTIQAFLNVWQQLELAIRSKVAQTSGESTANRPLSLLMRELQADGVISVNDAAKLREILDIRNRLVHAGREVGSDEVAEATKEARRLFEKLAINASSPGRHGSNA
jgi:uncharacterized protein YutE (UPF0331/DUF86 family)